MNTNSKNIPLNLYDRLIGDPVKRWYLRPLNTELIKLDAAQRLSIHRQAIVGWLQTILLIVAVIQSLFAGVLHALPPDLRASLEFLHRIEWAVYVGMVLILLQVIFGWSQSLVVTNRFYLLAWRFSKPRLLQGQAARLAQFAYIVVILLMLGAVLWVRVHGFIVQPR